MAESISAQGDDVPRASFVSPEVTFGESLGGFGHIPVPEIILEEYDELKNRLLAPDTGEPRDFFSLFADFWELTALIIDAGEKISSGRMAEDAEGDKAELLDAAAEIINGIIPGLSMAFLDMCRRKPLAGLSLTPVEKAAFSFAAALEMSRTLRLRLREYLDTVKDPGGSIGDISMLQDLCSIFMPMGEIRTGVLLSEDSHINRFMLQGDGGRDMGLQKTLHLTKEVMCALYGEPYPLGEEAFCLSFILPDAYTEDRLPIHEAEAGEALGIFSHMLSRGDEGILQFTGMEGIGKEFLAGRTAGEYSQGLLKISMSYLLGQDRDRQQRIIRTASCKCLFDHGVIYVDLAGVDAEHAPGLYEALAMLLDYNGFIMAGGERRLKSESMVRGRLHVIAPEIPGKHQQLDFWNYFLSIKDVHLSQDIDLWQIVSIYDLTPGRIEQICGNLQAGWGNSGEDIDIKTLRWVICTVCSTGFDRLAKRLVSPFTFEDLQLKESSLSLVRSAIDRIKYRAVVNEDFGFIRKLPYGQGMSMLLYGPPGTGKTMTAQVIANELGMEVYRVDLSQLSSKYIGETEKNLGAVFDAARYTNAILFFDEADALFAKRTEVSSSNDRHANNETAFLLQKIEEYPGVSILATNIATNFDMAFKRRITYMIPVDMPDEETRVRLWSSVFPPETPLAADVRFDIYARCEIAGSSIKSAAVAAAYLAAGEDRAVTNMDIIESIDAEYRKLGHLGIKQELLAEALKNIKHV